MRLSTMKTTVAETSVKWLDDDVAIGYFPAALTPGYLEDVQAAAENARRAKRDGEGSRSLDFAPMLLPLVAWWDVKDDKDERLPVNADTLRDMPLSFLTSIITATQEAMRPPTPAT